MVGAADQYIAPVTNEVKDPRVHHDRRSDVSGSAVSDPRRVGVIRQHHTLFHHPVHPHPHFVSQASFLIEQVRIVEIGYKRASDILPVKLASAADVWVQVQQATEPIGARLHKPTDDEELFALKNILPGFGLKHWRMKGFVGHGLIAAFSHGSTVLSQVFIVETTSSVFYDLGFSHYLY